MFASCGCIREKSYFLNVRVVPKGSSGNFAFVLNIERSSPNRDRHSQIDLNDVPSAIISMRTSCSATSRGAGVDVAHKMATIINSNIVCTRIGGK